MARMPGSSNATAAGKLRTVQKFKYLIEVPKMADPRDIPKG